MERAQLASVAQNDERSISGNMGNEMAVLSVLLGKQSNILYPHPAAVPAGYDFQAMPPLKCTFRKGRFNVCSRLFLSTSTAKVDIQRSTKIRVTITTFGDAKYNSTCEFLSPSQTLSCSSVSRKYVRRVNEYSRSEYLLAFLEDNSNRNVFFSVNEVFSLSNV